MVYRRQKKVDNLVFFVVFIISAVLMASAMVKGVMSDHLSDYLVIFLTVSLILATPLVVIVLIHERRIRQKQSRGIAALNAHGIDDMTGKEFELFLEHLLIARGYKVHGVFHGNDGGVDLVAKKDKERYSIQAKRFKHRHNVDRRAITDAVAGMAYRDCTKSMVITNSRFTKSAVEYATKTGCILVNRDVLAEWVAELSD